MRSSATARSSPSARHEADEVTREVLTAVRRTFITPFDRTDIQDLISSMDDAIDQMNKTAKTIMLFEVRSFEPQMQADGRHHPAGGEAGVGGDAAAASIGKNAGRLQAITEEIIRIEDQADQLHDQGRKALFLASREAAMPWTSSSATSSTIIWSRWSIGLEDVSNEINALIVDQL